MEVLLTGAFGNLGIATISELIRNGHHVRCFDVPSKRNKKTAGKLNGKVETFWGDIRDMNTVREAVSGRDAVVHNAAVLPPLTERRPEMAYDINVNGTSNIVRAMESSGRKPFLVYSSSVTVHGPDMSRKKPVSAEDPLKPTDQYSRHKVESEKIIRGSSLPWSILRIGVALDPKVNNADLDAFRMLFNISLENRLEYVHPHDVAMAQANAIQCADARNKIMLIGGGKKCQVYYRDLFGVIFDAIGIEMLPPEAFGKDEWYTDRMDTDESQRCLKYQNVTFKEYRESFIRNMRFVRLAVSPIRPVVKSYLLRQSGPWKKRKKA